MIEVGSAVDRYIVMAPLGSGGQAAVWLARHATLGSLHALKVLHVGSVSQAQRLLQEGRIQSRLDHPNLVPVTDAVRTGAGITLVMPFVAGPTLAAWLSSARPSFATTRAILKGVLAGLACAHREGVIHRDLKPGNILMASGPTGLVPRVTDFGVARELVPSGDDPLTRTGAALGTLAYMAPEQGRSASAADARADLYALGCIAYEMLTGRRAFPGNDLLEVLTAKAGGDVPPLRALVPDVPADLEAFTAACLRPAPEDRPPSCEAAAALLDLRAEPGAPTVPDSMPEQAPDSFPDLLSRRRHGSDLEALSEEALDSLPDLLARPRRGVVQEASPSADPSPIPALDPAPNPPAGVGPPVPAPTGRRRPRLVALGIGAAILVTALIGAIVVGLRGGSVSYPHTRGFALLLDGNSSVSVPPAASLDLDGPLTIQAWIRPEAWNHGDLFPVLDRVWRLEVTRHAVSFSAGDRTGSQMPVRVPLHRWSNVAVTWHPQLRAARWYLDGVFVVEESYDEPIWDHTRDPTLPLAIGASPFGRMEHAQGYLDDVRIWARELDPAEVLAAAQGGAVDHAELVGEWTFDDGPGSTVRDSSGRDNHGVVLGQPAWIPAHEAADP